MKLSIVLPTYNALEFNKKTVEHVLLYTTVPYELIITDDASYDGTKEWLESLTDPRIIKNFQLKNGGISKNWNAGLKLSTGEYVCFLNSDCLVTPGWELPLISALEKDPDLWIVSPFRTQFALPSDFPNKSEDRRPHHMKLLGACFMVRRELFTHIGYFPEELRLWYGDNWIEEIVTERFKKKTLHISDSYVHHFVSASAADGKFPDFRGIIMKDQKKFLALRERNYEVQTENV